MFASTIIPTIGRIKLSRAVSSVLNQSFADDDFEIVVVNDSGHPLPQAPWQQSARVRVLNTQRRERSVARNIGAAVARGKYLHFLDDDDWLSPDTLRQFWELAQYTDASWIYGGSQLVDRVGNPIIKLRHEMQGNCFLQVLAGEWIPLQASLVETAMFFAVGGFNPLLAGPEDIDLLRRIALQSDIAGIRSIVAFIERGNESSSTDYDLHPVASRWAREKILEHPHAFARMLSSARSSYWYGRIVRAYVTSAIWNMQRRCILNTLNRTNFALSAFREAGASVLSADFWRAIGSPYRNETFARGFREASGIT